MSVFNSCSKYWLFWGCFSCLVSLILAQIQQYFDFGLGQDNSKAENLENKLKFGYLLFIKNARNIPKIASIKSVN